MDDPPLDLEGDGKTVLLELGAAETVGAAAGWTVVEGLVEAPELVRAEFAPECFCARGTTMSAIEGTAAGLVGIEALTDTAGI